VEKRKRSKEGKAAAIQKLQKSMQQPRNYKRVINKPQLLTSKFPAAAAPPPLVNFSKASFVGVAAVEAIKESQR